MDEKFKRRFTSFCNSLDALAEAKQRDLYDSFVISDDAWMEMLKVRNELTHDYDCEIVKEHCGTIVETYIDLFYEFEAVVKKLSVAR